MSTWTQQQANIYSGAEVQFVASDGTDLYFVTPAGIINKYTVATNTVTAISDGSTFPAGTTFAYLSGLVGAGLVILGSGLYCARFGGGGAQDYCQVWKYDGSGTTWTKVYSSSAIGLAQGLWGDGSLLVVLNDGEFFGGSGVTNATAYSANGSSWTQGTIDSSAVAYGVPTGGNIFNGTQLGIFAMIQYSSTASDRAIYNFNVTTFNWDKIVDFASFDYEYVTSGPDYHWRLDVVAGEYQRTTNWASWTTPTVGDIRPVPQINLPYSVGRKVTFGQTDLYLWDQATNQWQAAETITASDGGTIYHVARMSDDTVLAFLKDSGNHNEIWVRDDPLPDPVSGPSYALTHSADGIPGKVLIA